MSIRHQNNGNCPKCDSVMSALGGVAPELREWFHDFQRRHPEAHVSCGNRGKEDQERLRVMGRSRAGWRSSAHNWGAALDIFEMSGDLKEIYEEKWFGSVLAPEIDKNVHIDWYGKPHSAFFELPHVQLSDWKHLVKTNKLKLCE